MRNYLVISGLVMLGVAAVARAQPKPVTRSPGAQPGVSSAGQAGEAASSGGPRSAAQKADEQTMRQMIAAFSKAYNAGDAKAVAGFFTVDAEIVDEEGTKSTGRAAIQGVFAEVFKAHPKTQIDIAVESIRFLSPLVAIEEGISTVKHEPGESGEAGHYSVIHAKQDGKWQMASARDLADDEATGAAELEQLGWLVGNWVDEDAAGLVKTSFEWADNHRFILGKFTIQVAGRPTLTGSQRIGWDPLAKKIRSWVFDSEGGFGESYWTRQGKQWIIKLSGVSRDGRIGSATNVYTRLGADSYSFSSHDRVLGGEVTDDTDDIIVVRAPPRPGKSLK